jgi:hypothetical protein
MNEQTENNVEQQLQDELIRLKGIVDYLEQVKSTHSQSQQLLESAEKLFAETKDLQENLKQDIQSSVSVLDKKVSKQISVIQKDLQINNDNQKLLKIDISDLQTKFKQVFLVTLPDIEKKNDNALSSIQNDIQKINKTLNEHNNEITKNTKNHEWKIENLSKKIKRNKLYFALSFLISIIALVVALLSKI